MGQSYTLIAIIACVKELMAWVMPPRWVLIFYYLSILISIAIKLWISSYKRRIYQILFKSVTIMSLCIECNLEVRPRQEALQCDCCKNWIHRTHTNIDRPTYRKAVKEGTDINWGPCQKCLDKEEPMETTPPLTRTLPCLPHLESTAPPDDSDTLQCLIL